MNKKRIRLILLMAMICTYVTLTGCSKKNADAISRDNIISQEVVSDNTDSTQNIINYSDNTTTVPSNGTSDSSNVNKLYGEVTAISDNEITLALGTLDIPYSTNNEENEKASKVKHKILNLFPSLNSYNEDKSLQLTLTGEEKTITISDESIITTQDVNSQVTGLSAILQGSTLEITYTIDDDNNEIITSVMVLNTSENSK